MRQRTSEEGFLKKNGGLMVRSDNGKLREKVLFPFQTCSIQCMAGTMGLLQRTAMKEGRWQEVLSSLRGRGVSGKLRCEGGLQRAQLRGQQEEDKQARVTEKRVQGLKRITGGRDGTIIEGTCH